MSYPVPPHWLRRNEGTRSPHRVMFVDTETRPTMVGRDELHELRWWHARVVRRHVASPRGPLTVDLAGDSILDLARQVDHAAITKHSLWVYTHNLGFDLQVTRLPELLHELGWQITDIGITGRSPWIRLAQERRRIVLADSTSWMPAGLADIGESIGYPKPVIEDWYNAPDEEIASRCLADVQILATAMIMIMDWWDTHDMGRWQWTGPGCGWAAFRHKHLHHKVLMDPDPERLVLERQAIYGGRREAFQIGTIGPGRYVDLDFEAAYPTIAATTELPRRSIGRVESMTAESYGNLPADWGILSACTVTTPVPVVPCRLGGHTLYPVGTFQTVLAQPDITGVLEVGGTVELGDTIVYQLAPFMSSWGEWVTSLLNGTGEQVPPPVRTWAKHISRTVIGRWAMRAQRTEDWGDAAWPYWHAEPGTDLRTGCEVVDLHACGRHLRVWRDAEPENVFPAVTAWVESTCRQLLRQALEQCPAGSVLQCDTDGFMMAVPDQGLEPGGPAARQVPTGEVATAGPPVPAVIPTRSGPVGLKAKAFYTRAVILGPQQVIADSARKIAGIPKAFTSSDGQTWQGNAWPGYTWQLANSQPGIYTRPHVIIPLRGPYGSRWVLRDGTTIPPRCIVRNGETIIVRPTHPMLADKQPEILAKYAA